MSEFDAQGLANTAWAFATVNQLGQTLFMASAPEVQRRVSEFNAQELMNTVLALATAKQSDEKLLTVLALEAERQVSELHAQEFPQLHHGMLSHRDLYRSLPISRILHNRCLAPLLTSVLRRASCHICSKVL